MLPSQGPCRLAGQCSGGLSLCGCERYEWSIVSRRIAAASAAPAPVSFALPAWTVLLGKCSRQWADRAEGGSEMDTCRVH